MRRQPHCRTFPFPSSRALTGLVPRPAERPPVPQKLPSASPFDPAAANVSARVPLACPSRNNALRGRSKLRGVPDRTAKSPPVLHDPRSPRPWRHRLLVVQARPATRRRLLRARRPLHRTACRDERAGADSTPSLGDEYHLDRVPVDTAEARHSAFLRALGGRKIRRPGCAKRWDSDFPLPFGEVDGLTTNNRAARIRRDRGLARPCFDLPPFPMTRPACFAARDDGRRKAPGLPVSPDDDYYRGAPRETAPTRPAPTLPSATAPTWARAAACRSSSTVRPPSDSRPARPRPNLG